MAFAANAGEMKEYAFALVMLVYVLGVWIIVGRSREEQG
jgi:hypothetical protein